MNQFWDCSHSLCVGGIGSCHMVSGTVNVWCWFIPLRWGLSPCRSSCNGCTTLPSLALSSRTAGVNAQIAAWSRVYQDHTRNSLVQSLNHLLLIIGDGNIEMKLRRDAAGHLYNIDTTVYTWDLSLQGSRMFLVYTCPSGDLISQNYMGWRGEPRNRPKDTRLT